MLNVKNDGQLLMKNSGCVNEDIRFSDLDKDWAFNGCEFDEAPDVKISCAKIQKCSVGTNCCILTQFISSQFKPNGTRFAVEPKIDAIDYNHNKKVESLIRYVEARDYLSIRGYDASGCAIKEVKVKNQNVF